MTENKRFELAPTNNKGGVVLDRGNILWRKEIIHLLNELHEENEELKRKHYNELMEEGVKIERLRAEIKQLKQENDELQQKIQGCKDDRLRFEEEARIDAIDKALDEENEKLRKENKELKLQLTVEEMDKEALTEQTAIDIEHYTKQNEKLQDQISMLKTTIARNEAYINRLTKQGEWNK